MQRGLTLIELLIVLALVGVLSAIAIPNIMEYYKNYKYQQYVLEVERTLGWARMVAMERSINVGICVQNNQLTIHNMGTRRSGICNGEVIKGVVIEENYIQLSASGGGTAFDPRGFAIFTSTIRIIKDNQCTCYTTQPLRGLIRRGTCTSTGSCQF